MGGTRGPANTAATRGLSAADGLGQDSVVDGPASLWYSRLFIFIFFENIFYRNIFSISQFTGLYPYSPAGGLPPISWAVGTYM